MSVRGWISGAAVALAVGGSALAPSANGAETPPPPPDPCAAERALVKAIGDRRAAAQAQTGGDPGEYAKRVNDATAGLGEAVQALLDCSAIARLDPHKLPPAKTMPGSYSHTYKLTRLKGFTPRQVNREVVKNLKRYFPINGMTNAPKPGQVIDLRFAGGIDIGPLGDHAPVRVVATAPTGFCLASLPGHPEGAYRLITFEFVRSGKNDVALTVSAWGPQSPATSLGPVNEAFTHELWKSFSTNVNKKFPLIGAQSKRPSARPRAAA